MNKRINFFPYYKDLLLEGKKTTTIRLREKKYYALGEVVSITTGWSKKNYTELFKARITFIKNKKIINLDQKDLEGESPDCKFPEAVQYVLSCIYKKVISFNDTVTIMKFEKI